MSILDFASSAPSQSGNGAGKVDYIAVFEKILALIKDILGDIPDGYGGAGNSLGLGAQNSPRGGAGYSHGGGVQSLPRGSVAASAGNK